MTKPALSLVDGQLPVDAPSYGALLSELQEVRDERAGLEATVRAQAGTIGRLRRQLEESGPEGHPQRKEIADLIDRWKKATGHEKAKQSKDRFEVIKARLKDGYSIEQLELAVDGIAAFPFVVNGQRVATGKPSQRHDALSLALKGGENTERFAVLGYQARKESA